MSQASYLVAGLKCTRPISTQTPQSRWNGFIGRSSGTIGGAIRQNAGTYLGEVGDVADWVEWLDARKMIHRKTCQSYYSPIVKLDFRGVLGLENTFANNLFTLGRPERLRIMAT